MLRAVGKRLLVKPEETKKEGTLILTNEKPKRFEVIDVGDEVTRAAVGNLIYLDKYVGVEIDYEGQKYTVIDEQNILAKILT